MMSMLGIDAFDMLKSLPESPNSHMPTFLLDEAFWMPQPKHLLEKTCLWTFCCVASFCVMTVKSH